MAHSPSRWLKAFTLIAGSMGASLNITSISFAANKANNSLIRALSTNNPVRILQLERRLNHLIHNQFGHHIRNPNSHASDTTGWTPFKRAHQFLSQRKNLLCVAKHYLSRICQD